MDKFNEEKIQLEGMINKIYSNIESVLPESYEKEYAKKFINRFA
ncbi:hypothetical protein [Clostridium sp. DMHC 10]|nr:hypothetical protein [Clostridium sp. DMHC 10]